MPGELDNALLDAVRTHNPWWDEGFDTDRLPNRERSDFYHLVRPQEPTTQFQDQPILGVVGRRGVGKTTLLEQFIAHQITNGVAPERFLYLPFDADPLYQLQSDTQLRQAIRYFESRVLGRLDSPSPHFVIVDDAHRIEHPTKPDVDGWATPIKESLDSPDEGRHVIVTASAGVQIRRELDRVDVPDDSYDIQPIFPEKFRDYIYSLYPSLETEARRVSPTSLRTGPNSLPAVMEGEPVSEFVQELEEKHDQVADVAARVQSQVVHYLAMGGVLAYDIDGPVESASTLSTKDYSRLWEDVRDALYQEVPGFETIQTIADLERVCALAARRPAGDAVRYQELVELLDVDRRTVRDSYLEALSTLYLVTPVVEYDNQRPRSVKLYLRDTGVATALVDGDGTRVLGEFDREAELAEVAAFDHTMRFAYNTQAVQGSREMPTVWYWDGEDGSVDFVFEIEGVPVPIGVAYRPGDVASVEAGVMEFRDRYSAPLGFVVMGDTVRSGASTVEYDAETGIVRVPYWLYLMLC